MIRSEIGPAAGSTSPAKRHPNGQRRSRIDGPRGPHAADAVVETTLIGAGTAIKFPKQPVLGGVGGNPWIWVQWTDDDGDAMSDEILMGRCVQDSD